MTIFQWIIPALWLLFAAYWGISALSAKRSIGTTGWWQQGLLRAGIVLLTLVVLHFTRTERALRAAQSYQTHSLILGAIGSALVLLGVGLAVYARFCLGRNWGMPMSRKTDPELVTTGPYKSVRHPIYSGIILAMIGSAIAISLYWLIAVVILAAYFVYSAVSEERYLTKTFPDAYPRYKQSTKMLIPFIF